MQIPTSGISSVLTTPRSGACRCVAFRTRAARRRCPTTSRVAVAATELPIDVPHAGSSVPLSAQDDRLNQAVVRNGRLWTNHQIEVNATGAAQLGGGRTAVRWYELQNLDSTPTVRQFGTVFDPTTTTPLSYFMGSVMVSGQGHMALGATVAGAAAFVNAAVTGRLASDPLAQMNGTPQVYSSNASFTYNLAPDSGPPPSQPWGGYSVHQPRPIRRHDNVDAAAVRERDQLVRPAAGPAAGASARAGTVRVPGRRHAGPDGPGADGDWLVGGRRRLFDPGAGFANRLAAAFSGAGVTITNTTVISPTQIALTVDTRARRPASAR